MLKTQARFFLAAIILPLLLVSGFACFNSCASRAGRGEDPPYAYLTDTSRFILLPAGDIEKSMDMAQRVSASYRNRDFLFIAWVKADSTGIEMTLLNDLGAGMGDLSYRDGAVSFFSPMFPQSLRPEYIVADFQLCFYNPLLLSRALKDCGLTLENSGAARRVLKGKDLIIEIEKTAGVVRLTNHLRGYAYTLEGDFS